MIKGQDILLLLKIHSNQEREWPFYRLAVELDMSPAEVHQAAKRCEQVGLLSLIPEGRSHHKKVNRGALEEFLLHAVRYVCPPTHGPITRGMPTSFGAPCFPKMMVGDELPPVWPTPNGKVRGVEFSPIHRSAPFAAERDTALYEMLVFVDALRGGKARERELAEIELLKRLRNGP